jgi:hypothetical protein
MPRVVEQRRPTTGRYTPLSVHMSDLVSALDLTFISQGYDHVGYGQKLAGLSGLKCRAFDGYTS